MCDNTSDQSAGGRSGHDNHPCNSAPLITHFRLPLSCNDSETDGSDRSTIGNNVMAEPGTQLPPRNSSDQQQQLQRDNKLVLYSSTQDTNLPSTTGHNYVQPPSQQQVAMPPSSSSSTNNIGLPEADELELFAKICKKRKTLEAEKVALREQIISLERAAVEQREKYETQLATERGQAEEDRKLYQTWREKVEEQNGKLLIKGRLIESKDREIAELKASLESVSVTSEQQKLQIEEKCEQLDEVDQKFNVKVVEFEQFKIESVETERKLGGEISELKEKLQRAGQEDANLKLEIAELKQLSECANVEFKRNVRELDDRVKMKQREIGTISNQRDSLQRECKTLHEEVIAMDGRILSLESESHDLKKQVDKFTGELKSKTELVQKILDEEKKYRSESTIDRLLKQDEMSSIASTTITASKQQQRRCSKRKSSPSPPNQIPGEVPVASVVATADTTISSSGPKPRQKRRGKLGPIQ